MSEIEGAAKGVARGQGGPNGVGGEQIRRGLNRVGQPRHAGETERDLSTCNGRGEIQTDLGKKQAVNIAIGETGINKARQPKQSGAVKLEPAERESCPLRAKEGKLGGQRRTYTTKEPVFSARRWLVKPAYQVSRPVENG